MKRSILLLGALLISTLTSLAQQNCLDFTDSTASETGYANDTISCNSTTIFYNGPGLNFTGHEGIYLSDTASFTINGFTNSALTISSYAFLGQFNQESFTLITPPSFTGTPHYLNETYPQTIDGLTVDLIINYTDPSSGWTYYDLVFTGSLAPSGSGQLNINQFESGITGMCFSECEVTSLSGCLDFTDSTATQTGYANDTLTCNSTSVFYNGPGLDFTGHEGIYGGGTASFTLNGFTNSSMTVSGYAFQNQFDQESFTLITPPSFTGTPHYLNETYPQTIAGLTVDLIVNYTDPVTNWTYYDLTFTGTLDPSGYGQLDINQFESGVTGICFPGCDSSVANIKTQTNDFELNAYPNPAIDFITIQSSEQLEMIQLFDLNGSLILVAEPKTNTSKIDVSSLKSGMYFYEATTNVGVQRQRFVKN